MYVRKLTERGELRLPKRYRENRYWIILPVDADILILMPLKLEDVIKVAERKLRETKTLIRELREIERELNA